jgi:UPF0176 protein
MSGLSSDPGGRYGAAMNVESPASQDVRIVAAYCFVPIAAPADVRARLLSLCEQGGIKGTLILAPEGFNGTLAGPVHAIDTLVAALLDIAGDARPEIKYAESRAMPFGKLKLKLKPEIVTMGRPGLDFVDGTGRYIDPQDWNALIAAPDTILVDTRNSYEVAIGTFAGATDPGTRSFTQFPGWLEELADSMTAEERQTKPLAMFCTGGIRCEKSTALAHSLGFERVFHLKGGILAYLEQVEEEASRWQGDCFVFDERVAVGHGLKVGNHALCKDCGMPFPSGETRGHAASCTAAQA